MSTPNLAGRPPTVSPAWWYSPRTSWHARQRAIRAWHRSNRPAEDEQPDEAAIVVPRGANGVSKWERTAAVELCFEAGWTAARIVEEMGVKAATIVRSLERAGRRDLIPDFDRIRRVEEGRRAA